MPVNVVVPALLAGNAVLLKHSPKTPSARRHFERAFSTLSVPDVVHATWSCPTRRRRRARRGLAHRPRRVHGLGATGGTCIRRRRRAADRRGLELGGKDPAYVAEDADLDFAAENVVDGACYNAGQSLLRGRARLRARERLRALPVEGARRRCCAVPAGRPARRRDHDGSARSTEARLVVDAQVRGRACDAARSCSAGGSAARTRRAGFFEPTLLAAIAANDALVMREESFGPIAAGARASASDDEALARMNDSRYGLTASVWTKSATRRALVRASGSRPAPSTRTAATTSIPRCRGPA